MYRKIQDIVDAAYRRAGTLGDGQSPTSNDSTAALSYVNDILDGLSIDKTVSPGTISRVVTPVQSKVVIANNPARTITYIDSNGSTHLATISTVAAHDLSLNDSVDLFGTSIIDGTYIVSSITSMTSFVVTGVNTSGVSRTGTFKLSSESRAYQIDLAIEPPTFVNSVVSAGIPLSAITDDEFYKFGIGPNEYYYEITSDPYPVLHLDAGEVTISFPQPGFVDVTLNTFITTWPRGLDQIVVAKLAAYLAAGYPDTVAACEAAYSSALATFRRAHRKSKPTLLDDSSPGFGRGWYDVDTDEVH